MYTCSMLLLGLISAFSIAVPAQRGQEPQTKQTATKTVQLRQVTTGRIRMDDPDTLLRIQRAGGAATALLRSTEKRTELQTGLRQRETRRYQRTDMPMFVTMMTKEPEQGSIYGVLFGSSGSYTFDAKFGDIAEGTLAPKAHYDGVASKTGLISVDQVTGGPFLATKIVTYTGYWVNGEPQVDQQKLAAGKNFYLPIKAGQEYTVYYMFDSAKLKQGAYKGTSVVRDGSQTTLNITGNIVPVKGNLSVGIGSYDPIVGTGQIKKIPLTLLYSGNSKNVSVTAKVGFVGGNVQSAKVGMPSKIDLTAGTAKPVDVTVYAENVVDGQYPVEVRISAPGAQDTVFKLDVSFRTLWLDSGAGGSGLSQYIKPAIALPRIRMNSLGYWELSGTAMDSSTFTGDRLMLAVFSSQVVNGFKHGMKYDMVLGGAANPSSESLLRSGYSTTVQKFFPQFASGGFQSIFSVNDIPGFNKAMSGVPFAPLVSDK